MSSEIQTKLEYDEHTQNIIKTRYLIGNETSMEDVFRRVAKEVSKIEADKEKWETEFYNMMVSQKFIPNSPLLWGAGTKNSPFACYVLGIQDSRESIFQTLKEAVEIESKGGGVGFNFSNLRPDGSLISTTGGRASGPCSFMEVFDKTMGEVVKQGKRGGAMMAVLWYWHPDIEKFVTAKQNNGNLKHFNISVMVDDYFMKKVEEDGEITLNHPYGEGSPNQGKKIKAKELWIGWLTMAWQYAEPGILFFENINRNQLVDYTIETTNPCGEQALPEYGVCNLGHINLAKLVDPDTGIFDFKEFKLLIRNGVRFLDNVIDIANYPIKQVKKRSFDERRVGLGIMGFADACILKNIKYGSVECLAFIEDIGKVWESESIKVSEELAKEKGASEYVIKCCKDNKVNLRRNVCIRTIAPTGTASMFAGCSSSVEPNFAFEYQRTDTTGSSAIVAPICKHKENPRISSDVWIKAYDVSPMEHLSVQATWQKYVDSAVSKTINAPSDIPSEEVGKVYMEAWRSGCKGITFYRDGSIQGQVLTLEDRLVPKRPKVIDCRIFMTSVKGSKWCIVLGLLNEKPYEVFAIPAQFSNTLAETGTIIKVKSGYYEMKSNGDTLNLSKEHISHEQAEICRLVSLSLRHGVPNHFIVEQLEKSSGDMQAMSRAIARCIKRYIPDGTRVNGSCENCGGKLIRQEGCVRCSQCTWTKCS